MYLTVKIKQIVQIFLVFWSLFISTHWYVSNHYYYLQRFVHVRVLVYVHCWFMYQYGCRGSSLPCLVSYDTCRDCFEYCKKVRGLPHCACCVSICANILFLQTFGYTGYFVFILWLFLLHFVSFHSICIRYIMVYSTYTVYFIYLIVCDFNENERCINASVLTHAFLTCLLSFLKKKISSLLDWSDSRKYIFLE